MSSSRKDGVRLLGTTVTPAAADDFLLRLANLADNPDAAAHLLAKYPEMLPVIGHVRQVFAFRRELRRAWNSQDARTRDWYLSSLRRGAALLTRFPELKERMRQMPDQPTDEDLDYLTEPPPQITPFEAALYYFQARVGDLAKRCAHVDCPAPYFIASKRAQKFCSEKCAGPANRESKRKWWADNRGKGGSR